MCYWTFKYCIMEEKKSKGGTPIYDKWLEWDETFNSLHEATRQMGRFAFWTKKLDNKDCIVYAIETDRAPIALREAAQQTRMRALAELLDSRNIMNGMEKDLMDPAL